jgi:hypothetical protein
MPSAYSPTYYEDRKKEHDFYINLGNQCRIAEEQRRALRKVQLEAHDDNYLIGLEPKLVRLLSLVQDYKVANKEYRTAIRDIQRQKHRALLKQNKEAEEKNKRLKHVLESCHRLRTQPEDVPPIDLGNGRYEISIEDPTAW